MLDTLKSNQLDAHKIQDNEDSEIHVVLNDQKEGLFLCPACDNSVTRDLSDIFHAPAAIRVNCTCKCGHVFRVSIERRRNFRKPVNLVGMCIYDDANGQSKKRLIKIHDISAGGVQFSVNDLPEFKVGAQIILEFRLDDRERTKMLEKGTVLRINSRMVGIKFNSTEHAAKLNLYLMG